uniref:Uncharacterized protein n=1 Tax=Chaetoceros debilis TaxID=122233 RepID=A0A7S3Q250_9STRA
MPSKEGYAPIPDVDLEKGDKDLIRSEDDDILVLAAKYPKANAQQRKFLGTLDHAIANGPPKVILTRLTFADFGSPQPISDLVASLKYPTVALVFTILSSVLGTFWETPFGILLFPYYSCIIAYLAALPATKAEIDKKAFAFFSIVEGQTKREMLGGIIMGRIEAVKSGMEAAVSPYKEKMSKAAELIKELPGIDCGVDIPDTTDIDEAFDKCTGKVQDIVNSCGTIRVSKETPRHLQSKKNFDKFVAYPLLVFFLAIQLIKVWQVQGLQPSEDSTSAMVADAVVRKLRASISITLVCDTDLIIYAVESYLTVVVQLLLTFAMAHVSVFAKNRT